MKWFVKCLRNYINFRGRASRTEFWYFILFASISVALAYGVNYAIWGDAFREHRGAVTIVGCFLFLPQMAVQMRRLHDVGHSGWWIGGMWCVTVLQRAFEYIAAQAPEEGPAGFGRFAGNAEVALVMVMSIYAVFLLYCFLKKGDEGKNKYGLAPLV